MSFPDFCWAVGEESSDPLVRKGGQLHRIDQLGQSGHLERQDSDLADVAALGVRVVRYGMPWRQVEVAPGTFDWTLWDRALAACERHGLEPVVDLCHFGVPDDLGGFCDPAWVDRFLAYVDAFLARYPTPRWFTPINEPMTAAVLSARYGMWNDRRQSDADYALALSWCTLANLEAHARIVADRDGWSIGAEALGVSAQPPADEWTELRLALEQASWDLHLGHPLHSLAEPAFARVPDALRSRIDELATNTNVVMGHDLYPVSVMGEDLTIGTRLDAYERWATEWHVRYRTPFWVAETSNLGLDVDQQDRKSVV